MQSWGPSRNKDMDTVSDKHALFARRILKFVMGWSAMTDNVDQDFLFVKIGTRANVSVFSLSNLQEISLCFCILHPISTTVATSAETDRILQNFHCNCQEINIRIEYLETILSDYIVEVLYSMLKWKITFLSDTRPKWGWWFFYKTLFLKFAEKRWFAEL